LRGEDRSTKHLEPRKILPEEEKREPSVNSPKRGRGFYSSGTQEGRGRTISLMGGITAKNRRLLGEVEKVGRIKRERNRVRQKKVKISTFEGHTLVYFLLKRFWPRTLHRKLGTERETGVY